MENVELVKQVIEAGARRDDAAVFAAYDQQIEWHLEAVHAPGSDFELVYHGHEGVSRFWRAWFEAWEDVRFEYEEHIDAGDRVISILTQRVRGRASGLEMEWTSYAQVWTVREGKIVRVDFFPTREEALRDRD